MKSFSPDDKEEGGQAAEGWALGETMAGQDVRRQCRKAVRMMCEVPGEVAHPVRP